MRFFVRLFWAFIFFTLFAFALNNQQLATVRWFFGIEWRTPMVIVVLAAFAGGCAIGVMAMLPSWWQRRRSARRPAPPPAPSASTPPSNLMSSEFGPEHPPREGL